MPVNSCKNRASSELSYKSNRPHVSMVWRLINTPDKSDVGGTLEEFVNHSPAARDLRIRVLTTSSVVYQPLKYKRLGTKKYKRYDKCAL